MPELHNLPQSSVLWGEGMLSQGLAKLSSQGIRNPIFFSVPFLDEMRAQFVEPFVEGSAGTFTDLPAHAPDSAIRAGLKAVRSVGAEAIVAHGGGSVLDAAKAVSWMHAQTYGNFLPIVALPTTLSGSEFSHYFGITETDRDQRFKRSYAVYETVPLIVIIDPVLIRNTPRQLLLSSAFKGIDHAVEGMRLVDIDHPHAIMAAAGVARFLDVLERWPIEGETHNALENGSITSTDLLRLQLSAWHCYFAPASVIYGLSHRIGHILGGTFNVPHSLTSCVTLAPVIRACRNFYGDKLRIFARDGAAALADRIDGAVARLGLARRVSDLGLPDDLIPQVAALLRQSYPTEVCDLGEGAEAKLDGLLHAIW